MGLIKSPISIIKFGVKTVTNTAFYSLAVYGAINVAINTYAAVNYLKSFQNPKQEIVQSAHESIDRKVRETTVEAIMGESLDQKIDKKIQETLAKYVQSGQLLDDMKHNEDYIDYSTR